MHFTATATIRTSALVVCFIASLFIESEAIEPLLRARIDYDVTKAGFDIDAGDFDSDGDNDLVITQNAADSLSFYSNAGNGTFEFDHQMYAGDSPVHIYVGDFDQDNDPDLAVTLANDDYVGIYFNNGGVFTRSIEPGVGDSP